MTQVLFEDPEPPGPITVQGPSQCPDFALLSGMAQNSTFCPWVNGPVTVPCMPFVSAA